MPSDKKPILKQVLRDEYLPTLGRQSNYFSIAAVKTCLERRKLTCPPATLTRYLHEFTRGGLIFAAGRGWYSTLATPFTLNRAPVSGLAEQLQKPFPLLDFSAWSTEQIAGYGHHLLAKFVTFVHTERDSMPSVFEFLRDQGFDAHLNPRGSTAGQFAIRDRTVVVRPRVTTQPVEEHLVTIEGLLVDLLVESRALGLMDSAEYFQIFGNATSQGRISMASLVDYARQRQPAANELLQSIKAGFHKNPALIVSES